MVFDAHDKAFASFGGGVWLAGSTIMKTAVDTISWVATAPTTAAFSRCADTTSSSRRPLGLNQWRHYLARKPGALTNGASFKDWDLPPSMRRVQRRLGRVPNGDRQMVDILGAVLTDGLEAVEAAWAEALAEAVHSAGVILDILARHR